ncbi:HNH endonuclease signature motif containing protein [Streptomyces mirabilis]|uniref:HNH endonuclease signature motif containing protein n=1 Tax=Streptomyces mirabilis TaxID=68239 RepID=UPI0033DC783F
MQEKMIEQPNGCMHWTGHTNEHGYGRLAVDGKMVLAHRAIYEALNGKIPDEAQVDHVCHNGDASCPGGSVCEHRRCVNPGHLEAVTRQENLRRSRLTTSGKEACVRGHQLPARSSTSDSSGVRRRCKECEREQHRKEQSGPSPTVVRAFCRNGHEMNEANTYINGTRAYCRACHRESMRARRSKKKER